MSSIPAGWTIKPLGEVATLQRGFDLPVQDRVSGNVPVFAANGPVGTHDVAKVAGPGVVTGRSGTLGEVHYTESDYWPLNTALWVKDFHGNDPKWVARLLKWMRLETHTRGTGVPTLNRNLVHVVPVLVPPIAEQRRIAAILDRADAIRRKRQQAIALTEELLRSAFLEMMNQWSEKCQKVQLQDTALKERNSFVNGPFGSDLLTSELQDTGVPVVYIRDIRDGIYKRVSSACVTKEKAQKLHTCNVKAGDVLIAKVGDPPGTAAIYPSTEPAAIVTQDVVRIRLDAKVARPEFVVGYLNSSLGKHQLKSIIVEATRSRFSLGDFKALTIEIPPIQAQEEFGQLVQQIRSTQTHLSEKSTAENDLFNSLLQRAFRGEL